jgi:hypothetical protein
MGFNLAFKGLNTDPLRKDPQMICNLLVLDDFTIEKLEVEATKKKKKGGKSLTSSTTPSSIIILDLIRYFN